MSQIARYLSLSFLATWWFSLTYLVRTGEIAENILTRFQIQELFLLAMLGLALLRPKLVLGYLKVVPYLSIILIIVAIVTIVGYLFAIYTEWYVPFSIDNRLFIQLLAFMASIAAGALVARVLITRSKDSCHALILGLAFALLGVLWQFYHQGLTGAIAARLHGFNGEPKGLGIFLVPFFVCFVLVPVTTNFRRALVITIVGLVILLSYSSTAIIALAVSMAAGLLLLRVASKGRNVLLVFLAIVGFATLVVSSEEIHQKTIGRFLERTQGMYTEGISVAIDVPVLGLITVDGNDSPVLRMLLDQPILGLSGVGYGMQSVFAYPFLIRYDSGFLDVDFSGYITPNLALLNHLPNYGLVPLGLMILGLWRLLMSYRRVSMSVYKEFNFLYFSSWFVISLLVYEISFKLIMLYIVVANIFLRISQAGTCVGVGVGPLAFGAALERSR